MNRLQMESAILNAALFDEPNRDRYLSNLNNENFTNLDLKLLFEVLKNKRAEFIGSDHIAALEMIAGSETSLNIDAIIDSFVKFNNLENARKIISSFADRKFDNIDYAYAEIEKARIQIEELSCDTKITAEPMADICQRLIDEAIRAEELDGLVDSNYHEYKTGLDAIDSSMGGLVTRRYYLIGARPGVGKTTFATTLMARMIQQKVKCVYLTREMTPEEIAHKLIACIGQIPINSVARSHLMSEDEKDRYVQALDCIGSSQSFIDDRALPSLERIEKQIRKHVYFNDVKVFFVDYAQIIKIDTKQRMAIYDRIETISAKMQELAKTLNVCIVVLSQLNREAVTNGTAFPTAANLKGGGSLEQDADGIFILHGEEKKGNPNDLNYWVIVEKSRFSQKAKRRLTANLNMATFSNGMKGNDY